jgi:hypothetical protein
VRRDCSNERKIDTGKYWVIYCTRLDYKRIKLPFYQIDWQNGEEKNILYWYFMSAVEDLGASV